MACVMCCPPLRQNFFHGNMKSDFKLLLFLPKQMFAERAGQLDLLAEDFSGLRSQNHSLKSFSFAQKKSFNCFDQIGFSTFLGTWLKTYQTKYFNELGHFWL